MNSKLAALSSSPSSSLHSSLYSPGIDLEQEDNKNLEQLIFSAINHGNLEKLSRIFDTANLNSTKVLQLLLTTAYPNEDHFYKYDTDDKIEADELLGPNLIGLNALHIACVLSDEEAALEILEFVYDFTAEIDAKKVLYEFMGRIWGNGNTALHLAAFMGLNELARRLLELGAAPNKVNERKYKPVDCANGEEMMDVFATVSECMLFEFNFPVEPPVKQVELESEASKRIRAKSSTDLNSIKMEEDAVGLNCKSMFALGLKQNEFLHLTKKRHSISNDSNIKPPLSINLPHGTSIPDQNSPLMSPIANSPIKSREEMTRSLTRQSKPPKFLRKVTFDPETLIFDLCSTGDATDPEKLSNLRECLGIALDAPVVPQKKRLSGLKIDVNEIYTPNQWLTPLHMACSSGNLAVVELLVCLAGSRVNLRDKEGWTALHCASAEGHMEIIKVLGRCQGWDGGEERDGWIYPPDGPIELNPRTRDGETPIEVALDENKAEIKALLDDSDEEDNSWRQDDSVESEEESESSEEDLRKRVVTRTATKNVRAHGILKASNESVADRPALAMFTPMNGIKQEDKLAHDLSASAPASFLSKKKMSSPAKELPLLIDEPSEFSKAIEKSLAETIIPMYPSVKIIASPVSASPKIESTPIEPVPTRSEALKIPSKSERKKSSPNLSIDSVHNAVISIKELSPTESLKSAKSEIKKSLPSLLIVSAESILSQAALKPAKSDGKLNSPKGEKQKKASKIGTFLSKFGGGEKKGGSPLGSSKSLSLSDLSASAPTQSQNKLKTGLSTGILALALNGAPKKSQLMARSTSVSSVVALSPTLPLNPITKKAEESDTAARTDFDKSQVSTVSSKLMEVALGETYPPIRSVTDLSKSPRSLAFISNELLVVQLEKQKIVKAHSSDSLDARTSISSQISRNKPRSQKTSEASTPEIGSSQRRVENRRLIRQSFQKAEASAGDFSWMKGLADLDDKKEGLAAGSSLRIKGKKKLSAAGVFSAEDTLATLKLEKLKGMEIGECEAPVKEEYRSDRYDALIPEPDTESRTPSSERIATIESKDDLALPEPESNCKEKTVRIEHESKTTKVIQSIEPNPISEPKKLTAAQKRQSRMLSCDESVMDRVKRLNAEAKLRK